MMMTGRAEEEHFLLVSGASSRITHEGVKSKGMGGGTHVRLFEGDDMNVMALL